MHTSLPASKKLVHTIDTFIVPDRVAYLKSLRHNNDAQSLYQAIILGGAFIEGLGLLWFKTLLDSKGAEFHWEDGFPFLGMGQVIKLLKSVKLINEEEYSKFIKAARYRNHVAHKMYAQWAENLGTLGAWADSVIERVEFIETKLSLKPT